jgi:hypothetical protein
MHPGTLARVKRAQKFIEGLTVEVPLLKLEKTCGMAFAFDQNAMLTKNASLSLLT